MKRIINWFKAVYGIVSKLEAVRTNFLYEKTEIYGAIKAVSDDIGDVIRTTNEAFDVNDEADADTFAQILRRLTDLNKRIDDLDENMGVSLEMMAEVSQPPLFHIGQMVAGRVVSEREVDFVHNKFDNCSVVYSYKVEGDDKEYTEEELNKIFNNK